MDPTVVGVDLSLTATGFAWSTGGTALYGKAGLTKPFRTVKGVPTPVPVSDRVRALSSLAGSLGHIVLQRPTDLVVIENLPSTGIAASSPEKAFVWWRLVELLTEAGRAVIEVTPKTAKLYGAGRGDANKREVVAAIARDYPAWDICPRNARGRALSPDDNLADAVSLMAIGCHLLGRPIVPDLPAVNVAALTKLTLPALKDELRG